MKLECAILPFRDLLGDLQSLRIERLPTHHPDLRSSRFHDPRRGIHLPLGERIMPVPWRRSRDFHDA